MKILTKIFLIIVIFTGYSYPDILLTSMEMNPLVVQIVSFTAHIINQNDVKLDWVTVSETNNYGFYVQRKASTDANFQTLPKSFVQGNGTTLAQYSYSWIDSGVADGIYKYRLMQVDLDGGEHFSSSIEITVLKINQYTITSSTGANGTITPSGSVTVNYNGIQQFTFTANTGYHLDSLIVDGVKIDSTVSYTFRNVAANHTIRTVFKINQYTITSSTGANGTITPSGSVTVNYNGTQQFTFVPNAGYHLDSLIVDGVKIDSTVSYTFRNVTANHTIRTVFKINQYTITATTGANGTLTPLGVVTLNYNSTQQFTFAPNTGYHLDSLMVDGVKIDSTVSYTFRNVTTNHTIRTVFKINQYTITATTGANGTLTPLGVVTLNYNSTQQFTFAPNTGYYLDSLLVDGIKIDSTVSYTFRNVAANHTIHTFFGDYSIFQAITVNSRWNIISVPLRVTDYRVSTLFPTATSQCWRYEGGYISSATLQNGKGYWLKFPSSQNVTLHGLPIHADTIAVSSGWNMVGSISNPVPVASITSIPALVTTSNFYAYAGGYQRSDTIFPGKGYWVKISQAGSIILSNTGPVNSANTIRIVPSAELPPSPPDYVSSEQTVTPKEYALGNAYPSPFNPATTIHFDLPRESNVVIKLFDVLGREVRTILNEKRTAGSYDVSIDASGLPSGLYFYRIVADEFSATKKMMVVK